MNKFELIPIEAETLKEGQQVIVVDYDAPDDQEHFCIGRVEGLADYRLRFWKQAKNDEERSIWVGAENGEFGNRTYNYETRIAFMKTLILNINGEMKEVKYSHWQYILNTFKIGLEISFSLEELQQFIH